MPPKPAEKRRASDDDKGPAKKPQVKVEKTDCPGCLYLKRYYPDVPLASLRMHCGRHPVDAETLKKDGLPPPEPPPPPEQLPDDYLPFIDKWDGRIRTVWATAESMFPPESSSWEHLIEWSTKAREEFPKLTVNALGLMLRRLMPDDPDVVRRFHLIHKDEVAAERATWKKLATPARPPDDKTEQVVRQEAKEEVKPDSDLTPEHSKKFMQAGVPEKKTKVPNLDGGQDDNQDAFGYRLGTRAAKINAHLMSNPKKWFTSKEIEQATNTTSAGSHLSSLYADGWLEYEKVTDGGRGGKYRVKKN